MNVDDLYFTTSHEWLSVSEEDGETIGTIGISDFAVKELSDVVYIDLPAVGSEVKSGETFGEVESVKAVSDLYAPVSGEVIEVNAALADADNLHVLSEDPYQAGWMLKIRLHDPSEVQKLMDRHAYLAQLEK